MHYLNSHRKSHTHLQFTQADTRPKIAKEYVCQRTERQAE